MDLFPQSAEPVEAAKAPDPSATKDPPGRFHSLSLPPMELAKAGPEAPAHRAAPYHPVLAAIFIVAAIYFGQMLARLPWQPVWTENAFVFRYPALRSVLGGNFVRGLFSGLGIIDVWMGVAEALAFRRRR